MTKNLALLTIVLATSTAQAEELQMNDPHYQLLVEVSNAIDDAFYRDDKTRSWLVADNAGDMEGARCTKAFAALTKAGVSGSRKVRLKNDTPALLKGQHTIDDLRPVCENIERLGKIRVWSSRAILAARESFKIGGNKYYDIREFQMCVELYADLMKAGVASTMKVPAQEFEENGNKIAWSGTVEELRKKWCDVGLAKVKAETAVAEAPYRKVLKSDKLTMALQTGAFYVPGGKVTSDPKTLAAAKVWFSDTQSVNSDRRLCNGGAEIHVVHRYQFDATHKLVKTTDTQYCGKVPARAFK